MAQTGGAFSLHLDGWHRLVTYSVCIPMMAKTGVYSFCILMAYQSLHLDGDSDCCRVQSLHSDDDGSDLRVLGFQSEGVLSLHLNNVDNWIVCYAS